MNNAIAKQYKYNIDGKNKLPEMIQIDDKNKIDEYYKYFTQEKNIVVKSKGKTLFRSPLSAKIEVKQKDNFNLNINVMLRNENDVDWFVPRFEILSLYSISKIFVIDTKGYVVSSHPESIMRRSFEINGNKASVLRPVLENITGFANFTKKSTYKLNFLVPIPQKLGCDFDFEIFYQDYKVPPEIYSKFFKNNESQGISLNLKSNTVKVHCQAIDGKVENGFRCSFE
nr:hypothetical protein [Acinetobacter sp. Marseille-Q1620]